MPDRIGFVLVEYNQASGQPRIASDDVYDSHDEAEEQAQLERERTAKVGRGERHVVAELMVSYDD